MASRSSALRACEGFDRGLAQPLRRRRALIRGCCLVAFALSQLRCQPDFASLTRGASPAAGGGSGGASSGGSNNLGGTSQAAGAPTAGERNEAGGGSAGSAQAAAGSAASAGENAAGTGGTGGTGGFVDGAAGEAGAMPVQPCVSSHTNAFAFDGFDGGLTGMGFDPVLAVAAQQTSNGSTASVAWDATVGRTCPGAFRVTGAFNGYSSGGEVAIGDVRFPSANWSGAIALHAWVKVDPATAPLQGTQLFVVSGSNGQLFASVFDSSAFSYGVWYEMIVPLKAGTNYDPTTVSRVGVQIVLRAPGSPGIPATPPTTSAWLDDVWVEQ